MHPSTEILCMAYAIDDESVKLVKQIMLTKKNLMDIQNYIFTAHNSMFENYIWHNILVKRHGWTAIPLKRWQCTSALAATHALPRSLEGASTALGLKHQKNLDGKRVMLKMCKPRTPSKHNKAKWHNDSDDFEKLYDYCINDVEVERGIHEALPSLCKKEQEIWLLDQRINTRGIAVDIELVESALYLISEFIDDCNAKIQLLTEGYVESAAQVGKMKEWIAKLGVHIESLTKDSIVNLINSNLNPKILTILKLRQQVAKTSVKKFLALQNSVAIDGRVRDTLIYHGASTGRWTGKIVQPHNLPRGTVKDTESCIALIKKKDLDLFKTSYPDVMGAISSCVRGAFISAPDKDLFVVDFASIEARVLAWIAKQEDALKGFRTGQDSYVKMAEAIFNTEEVTSEMRFVGKTAVLGCGYGMGWKVFQSSCESMGHKVSEIVSKLAVSAFRKYNPNIKELWYDIETAAIRTVKTKKSNIVNNIMFHLEKDFLYCTLPSGRKLAYHKPEILRIEKFNQMRDALSFMGVAIGKQYLRQTVWGGTLVENIVQATARDILAEAILRVDKAGYEVVLHVHDEIVAEVNDKNSSLNQFISLITALPAWAKGCPIAAKGWRGKRYKKE